MPFHYSTQMGPNGPVAVPTWVDDPNDLAIADRVALDSLPTDQAVDAADGLRSPTDPLPSEVPIGDAAIDPYAGQPPLGPPDAPTAASPAGSSSTSTRTRTSTSTSGGQRGGASVAGPTPVIPAVEPAPSDAPGPPGAISGGGMAVPAPAAQPAMPAVPAVAPGTTGADGIIDPFGETPEAQKAAADDAKVKADAALDEDQAFYENAWLEEANKLPTTQQEHDDQDYRLTAINDNLLRIGAQRTADAGDQVAAANDAAQKELIRRQTLADRDAAIKQQAVESMTKMKMAHVDGLDEEAMNKKIDRSWGNGSTGSIVMTAISVALAGLGSALKGDGAHNPALDIVMKQIDQKVADQYAHKNEVHEWADKKRSRLDVYKNSAVLDIKQQQEAMRVHLLKQTADEMEAAAANLPAAKKALAMQLQVATRQAALKGRVALDKDLRAAAQKKLEDEEKVRHNKEAEKAALLRSKAAQTQAYAVARTAKTGETRETFEERKWDDPTAVAARKADADMKRAKADAAVKAATTPDALKAARTLSAQIKAQNDAMEQGIRPMMPEVVMKADGSGPEMEADETGGMRPMTRLAPVLLMKDGVTPVMLNGTVTTKDRIRNVQSSVRQSIELIDDLDRMIDKEGGWNSKLLQSDAYKEKIAKIQALGLENISTIYQMGVPNGKDDERVEKLSGGDPNQFRSLIGIGDPRAGLKAMRDVTERKFFNLLSSNSTFDGTAADLHIPEDTREGRTAALAERPSGEMVKQMEGRVGRLSHGDDYSAWAKPGRGINLHGVPTHKAADAYYKAADSALGLNDVPEAEGKAALAKVLLDENHDPAWQLAAGLAFENRIDLGIPNFNEADYARLESLTPEARAAAGGVYQLEDPTGGRAGTLSDDEAADAKAKRTRRAYLLWSARRNRPASAPAPVAVKPAPVAATGELAGDEPDDAEPDADADDAGTE